MVSKIKLLFLLDPADAFQIDASERAMNEITVMMDKSWEVHLTSSRKVSYEKLTCNHKVHKVKLISSLTSILSRTLFLILSVFKGVEIARKHGIHAIMCKGGHLHLGSAVYLLSRITRRKCVIRVNEDDVLAILLFFQRILTFMSNNKMFLRTIEVTLRKIESLLLKRVDWIVTQGPMDYERIRKLTTKVTFVPLWVDTEMFTPMSNGEIGRLRKELLKIGHNTKVVLFVGRLHPEKDIVTLLSALKKTVEICRNVILILVGTGPEERKCRELVEKLDLADKVIFFGYVPHDQVPAYYNIADVYVLTSIWEEWSNTIMEAMACGTPVIATDVGGNPYLVKDGKTGFLVPPRKPYILAKKIAYVFDHPNEVDKITRNARLKVKKFTKNDVGEMYKKAIMKAIERKYENLQI